jgi:hypothetical protein
MCTFLCRHTEMKSLIVFEIRRVPLLNKSQKNLVHRFEVLFQSRATNLWKFLWKRMRKVGESVAEVAFYSVRKITPIIFYQCCRSGIRCLFDPWIRLLDPGSWIPTHIFEILVTIFWVKSFIIHYQLTQHFFYNCSKMK